eukprot:11057-Heterococcus_DN1.PRE.1
MVSGGQEQHAVDMEEGAPLLRNSRDHFFLIARMMRQIVRSPFIVEMCLLDARAAYTALIFAEGRTSKLTLSHKAARASPAAAAATGTKRKDSASSSSEDAAKSITLRVKTTGDGREYKVPVR